MTYLETAAKLIMRFEGCYLEAYTCPAGLWTIGYGSTRNVKKDMKIDQSEAIARLMEDMKDADECIDHYCEVSLNDNERAALISFVFNVGCGNFRSSTLLKLLNNGDYEGAAKQFPRWDKARGKVLAGLTKRRLAEKDTFEGNYAD